MQKHILLLGLFFTITLTSETGCNSDQSNDYYAGYSNGEYYEPKVVYEFEDEYWETALGCYGFQASMQEVMEAMPAIYQDFLPLFEPDFIEAELDSIILVKDLRWYNDGEIAGLYPGNKTIAINTDDQSQSLLVHEFIHAFDDNHESEEFMDNFSSFNLQEYGGYDIGTGKTCVHIEKELLRHMIPDIQEEIWLDGYDYGDDKWLEKGFVSEYSTSSYYEDFAEFVTIMILRPNKIKEWAGQYPNIQSKVDLCLERFEEIGYNYNY